MYFYFNNAWHPTFEVIDDELKYVKQENEFNQRIIQAKNLAE